MAIVPGICPLGKKYLYCPNFFSADWFVQNNVTISDSQVVAGASSSSSFASQNVETANSFLYMKIRFTASVGTPGLMFQAGWGANASVFGGPETYGPGYRDDTNRMVIYYGGSQTFSGTVNLPGGFEYVLEFETQLVGPQMTTTYWLYASNGTTLLETNTHVNATAGTAITATNKFGFEKTGNASGALTVEEVFWYGNSGYSSDCLGENPIGSFIGGTNFNILHDFKPSVERAIEFLELDNGNVSPDDSGVDEDIYRSEISYRGTRAQMIALLAILESTAREEFTMTLSRGLKIFGPDVWPEGDPALYEIDCIVEKYAIHKRESFPKFSFLDVTLRALAPEFNGTPAFTALTFARINYTADMTWEITKNSTYAPGTIFYADVRSDAGHFRATFFQREDEYIAIRRYILVTARGDAIAFPNIQGVEYPWGPRGPEAITGEECRITFFGNERRVGLWWAFEMELTREV